MIIYTLPRAIIVPWSQTLATLKPLRFPRPPADRSRRWKRFWKNSWPWCAPTLAHGHFEISVSGEDGKAGCTSVIITRGRSQILGSEAAIIHVVRPAQTRAPVHLKPGSDAIDANVEAQIASLGPEVPVMASSAARFSKTRSSFGSRALRARLTREDARPGGGDTSSASSRLFKIGPQPQRPAHPSSEANKEAA